MSACFLGLPKAEMLFCFQPEFISTYTNIRIFGLLQLFFGRLTDLVLEVCGVVIGEEVFKKIQKKWAEREKPTAACGK